MSRSKRTRSCHKLDSMDPDNSDPLKGIQNLSTRELITRLRDHQDDIEVSRAIAYELYEFKEKLDPYIEDFIHLLKLDDYAVRYYAMMMLWR